MGGTNLGKRNLVAKVVRTIKEIENQVAGPMTGTTVDIQSRCDVATTNILRHLKAMNALGESHIYDWVQSNTTWVARWAAGAGENAPIPKMTREERLTRERARAKEKREKEVARYAEQEMMTPEIALKHTDEFIQRVKRNSATWYSPLTHYGA